MPAIIARIGRTYRGYVYNLAVEEDESYHAEGIVTHNCRSLIVPIGISSKVGVDEWITEAEIEEARGKADASFLVETREAWRAYREGAAN